jgi:hypothetical protein
VALRYLPGLWPGWSPSWGSRSLSASGLVGHSGCPPGSSNGELQLEILTEAITLMRSSPDLGPIFVFDHQDGERSSAVANNDGCCGQLLAPIDTAFGQLLTIATGDFSYRTGILCNTLSLG